MALIVDASVAVKWFLAEHLHDEARSLLTSAEPLLAPDILATEFANVMWVKTRRGEIEADQAARALSAVAAGVPQLRRSIPLLPQALELARELDHPVYDCIYLALAQELSAPLVTADQRLISAVEDASLAIGVRPLR